MNTFRSTSSDPAPRPAPTRDEAVAWEELFAALRDYSAAISTLEELTVDWLAGQTPAGSAPSEHADLATTRLNLAEAACARARSRCAEALARLDALTIPLDRSARIIPFPIDRRPSATPRPADTRPARPPRRGRRPRLRLIASRPAG